MRSFLACTAVALSILCGCNKSTEVLVVMSTDLVMPAEADSLQLDITRADDGSSIFSKTYPLTSADSLPASLDLHGSRTAPVFALRAQLRHGANVLVERRAVVPFEPDRALELRIPLERSCLASTCMGDETCLGGKCVPVTVKPSDLTPISKDPLAQADLATAGINDLGPSLDLASSPDLFSPASDMGMDCGVPEGPGTMTGCVSYEFSSGSMGDLTIVAPADVKYDFACGNLNIHLLSGSYSYPKDVRVFLANDSKTSNVSIIARYDVEAHGLSWAGVGMRAGDSFVRGETRMPASSGVGDLVVLHDDPTNDITNDYSQSANGSAVGGHHVQLERFIDTGGQPSTYDFIADSIALTTSPAFMPDAVRREFSVGNYHGAFGAVNPIDVHLRYLQLCDL